MKKIIIGLLVFSGFLSGFQAQHVQIVSALSEQTETCIDEVYGEFLNIDTSMELDDGAMADIEDFCLSLQSQTGDLSEWYFSWALYYKEVVEAQIDSYVDNGGFSIDGQEDFINLINGQFVFDLRNTREDFYDSTGLDDYEPIEYAYDYFTSYADAVIAGLNNNYLCYDASTGNYEDSDCYCFIDMGWDPDGAYYCAYMYYEVTQDEEPSVDDSVDSSDVSETENPFSDISERHKNYDAVIYLYDQGVIGGYSDSTFKPDSSLNRAELLKILVEGAGYTPDDSQYADCFTDVADEWFAKYACYAKEQGWVEGYSDGSFKPSSYVNKVEALKMLLEVFGISLTSGESSAYSDVSTTDWYSSYVLTAESLGLLEEIGSSYSTASEITLGGVSENIYRLLLQL